jgi:hypothetical protein
MRVGRLAYVPTKRLFSAGYSPGFDEEREGAADLVCVVPAMSAQRSPLPALEEER